MDLKTILIVLIRSAFNDGDLGTCAQALSQEDWKTLDWAHLHTLATQQSLEGITWCGIEAASLCEAVPTAIRSAWNSQANNTLRRRVLFDAERDRVFEAMHQAGLATLQLKGSITASYYPDPRMRSMADVDVLYGFVEQIPNSSDYRLMQTDYQSQSVTTNQAMQALVRIMTDLGYEVKNLGKGLHDTFFKEPVYNFETHRRLFSAKMPFSADFDNPWERAIPDEDTPVNNEGTPLSFHYIAEDEYVYLICHAYKHHETSGCGLRFLADMEAMRRAREGELDWNLIDMRMQQLNIATWEASMRALSYAAFSPEGSCNFSCEQANELDYLFGSHAYGTLQNRIVRALQKEQLAKQRPFSKILGTGTYIKHRLFLDEQTLQEVYPFCFKHRWARIGLPLFRTVRGCLSGNVQQEIKTLLTLSKKA